MKVNVSRLLFGSVAAAAAASSALQGARAATVEGTGSPGEGFGTCSSGDCENGWGVKDYGEDYLYEGEFRDGEHHGVGIESMPEGIQYIGQFKEGTPFGLGTMRFPAQAQAAPARGYTGQWKNDWPDGCGRDGDSEGIFVEGAFTEPADCSKELAAAEALVRSVLERAGYDSEAFFATGGGGGDSGQEQQLTKEELEEYMQGVRAAIEEHRQKGEDEHVAQATQVLEDMQRQYDALLRGEGQPPAQSYTASDESAAELLERIEQVREAIQMHEERGESEHVEGATQVLRELEAQLDEVRNGGGSYGGDDDISVEELMERIEQVREAIQMHEERGESEHVEGATQVLRELEAQLDEVRNGGGSYGGDDDISVEELMERIEQVREAIQMHEERGESEHVEGATQVLRELEAQLDEVRNGGGSYGGDDDISVEELMERIEQVREAIQMHEERGESEHVEGATQVLRELEAQLDEVRNGGGSYGGDDDISVEELMERIEQVREAIQMHEERGESEHVEGATQSAARA